MKTYNFSVSIPEFKNGTSIIDSFINEAKDEQRQLAITHAINKETSKVHKEILLNFTDKINEELYNLGIKFQGIEEYDAYHNVNSFKTSCKINGVFYTIYLEPMRNKLFKDSKYPTYTGQFSMEIRRYVESWTQKVHNVEDVLKYMKPDIIKLIKVNPHIMA